MLKKSSILILITIGALAIGNCGPGIPIKVPRYPEGMMGDQVKAVMSAKRKIGIVAVQPNPTLLQQIGYQQDWSSTVEGAVQTSFQKKGFYTMIDMGSRKARLRELAYSQLGLTAEQKNIGNEIAADGLLFIRMTAPPLKECKTELKMDLAATALKFAMKAKDDGQSSGPEKKPTGVLYLTVFVQATLTNLETGQSVTYAHSKPYKLDNDTGNPECPSTLEAFDKGLEFASESISDNLSPSIVTVKVPLAVDPGDMDGDQKAKVEKYLQDGIKWAEADDFQMASKSWEKALTASGGKSASALWNLAAFKWYSGDMDGADRYFKQSFDNGGADWLDTAKRELWAIFRKEKDRKSQEGN